MIFRLSVMLLVSIVCRAAGAGAGSPLMAGGGKPGPEIVKRFAELAGGFDALIVVIPTAGAQDRYDAAWLERSFLRQAGFSNLVLLHTRDRQAADSEAFAAPFAEGARRLDLRPCF